MSYMFYGCNSLTNIDFFNFTTNQFYDVIYVFDGCNSLLKNSILSFYSSLLNMKYS